MRKISIIIIILIIVLSLLINDIPISLEFRANNENVSIILKSNENDLLNIDTTNIVDNNIKALAISNGFNQGGSNKFFTANQGQVNDEVSYYIEGRGVWFTSNGMLMELLKEKQKSAVVRFDFVNCNDVDPIGIDELPHRSNFFYGNDSRKWSTNVPNYKEIYYENIYDNIDLKYY